MVTLHNSSNTNVSNETPWTIEGTITVTGVEKPSFLKIF